MYHIVTKEQIGPLLKQLRARCGFTVRTAAEGIGVSQPLLTYWENGTLYPRVENLGRVLRYYGVTASIGEDPS